MTVCPNCKAKVTRPFKKSPATLQKQPKLPSEIPSSMDLFMCPKCQTLFLAQALPRKEFLQTANVKNASERLWRIREELMGTLKELREKIQVLEAERARLAIEVEGLRKAAESRVAALESEVGQMREEAKSLRELLANNTKTATNSPDMQILPNPH